MEASRQAKEDTLAAAKESDFAVVTPAALADLGNQTSSCRTMLSPDGGYNPRELTIPTHRRSQNRGRAAEWGRIGSEVGRDGMGWNGWRPTPSLLSSCSCSHREPPEVARHTRHELGQLLSSVHLRALLLLEFKVLRSAHGININTALATQDKQMGASSANPRSVSFAPAPNSCPSRTATHFLLVSPQS